MAYLPVFDPRMEIDQKLISEVESLIAQNYDFCKNVCDNNIEMLSNNISDYKKLIEDNGFEISIKDRINSSNFLLMSLKNSLTMNAKLRNNGANLYSPNN